MYVRAKLGFILSTSFSFSFDTLCSNYFNEQFRLNFIFFPYDTIYKRASDATGDAANLVNKTRHFSLVDIFDERA